MTVHHYRPIVFTIQGESWLGETPFGLPSETLGTSWDSTEQKRNELASSFDAVASYARTVDRSRWSAIRASGWKRCVPACTRSSRASAASSRASSRAGGDIAVGDRLSLE